MKIKDKIKKYHEFQAELQTLELDIKEYFEGFEDDVVGLSEEEFIRLQKLLEP